MAPIRPGARASPSPTGSPTTNGRQSVGSCRGATFAVIPDVIDGTEEENDALVMAWPLPEWFGAPVWHMHEDLSRLDRLVRAFPRVCLGSSGKFATVGNAAWWVRMAQAMRTACDSAGRPHCKLHGLRMLDPQVFTRLPFSSADSTNIARNIGIDQTWKGNYMPPTKDMRAQVMRSRIEANNSPPPMGVRRARAHHQGDVFLNIYETGFFANCPNNGQRVEYRLKIETERMVPVEEIVAIVEAIDEGFHEEIADDLFKRFGGRQTLVANHHSVNITTVREP